MPKQLPYTFAFVQWYNCIFPILWNSSSIQGFRVILCMVSAKWTPPYQRISAKIPTFLAAFSYVQLADRCFYLLQGRKIIHRLQDGFLPKVINIKLALLNTSEKCSFHLSPISAMLVRSFVPSFDLRGITEAILESKTCFMRLYSSLFLSVCSSQHYNS